MSGEPAWLQERRTRAAERALSLGLPSQKQEVWKYTSAARFLLDDDISAIGPVDSSTLSSDARATLDKQAAWLAKYPQVQVQVAGNADERGTTEYNLALGQRRATTARDYLAAHGVNSSRMSVISFGKDRPTALGSDEQSWAQNRNAITSVR